MICPKCKHEYSDELTECPLCYEPKPLASLFVYKETVQRILHHPIVIVIAILFSVFAASYLLDLPEHPLLFIIPFILSVVTAIGCWLIWAKSSKQKATSGHFGLAETLSLSACIALYVVVVILIGITAWIFYMFDRMDTQVIEATLQFILGETIYAHLANILTIGFATTIILDAICIAAAILMLVRYSRFFLIYDLISKSLYSNIPPLLTKSAYSVLTWISSGVLILISLIVIPSHFTTGLRMLLYSVNMILVSILYNTHNEEIESVYNTYQRELGARKQYEREQAMLKAAKQTVSVIQVPVYTPQSTSEASMPTNQTTNSSPKNNNSEQS